MCPCIAEHLTEKQRSAVDDARLAAEPRRGGDESDDLDDPDNGVDSDQRVDRRKGIECADPRALASSGLTSAPTLPVAAMSPATIGTCPAV